MILPMRATRTVVACLLAVAANAQTFIVDAANGPGTNFPDLVTAIAAVPDGAVLRVRAGTYSQFFVDGKGVTLLGESGARIVSLLGPQIANLQPQQSFCMRGFVLDPFFGGVGTAGVTVLNNQGTVTLDGLGVVTGTHRLTVQQSNHVLVRDCIFSSQVSVASSNVAFTACSFSALNWTLPTIAQQGGRVQLAGCTVLGGSNGTQPAATCVQMTGGDLRVLGGGTLRSAGIIGFPGLAVGGSGSVRIDPNVAVLAATPPFAPGVTATSLAMPDVTAACAPLGGTLTAALHGPIGSIAALSVAFPGPSLLIPGLPDPLFWNLATAVNQTVGIPTAQQPVTSQIPVPMNPVFVGVGLVHHGFTLDPVGGLQVSQPVAVVVL